MRRYVSILLSGLLSFSTVAIAPATSAPLTPLPLAAPSSGSSQLLNVQAVTNEWQNRRLLQREGRPQWRGEQRPQWRGEQRPRVRAETRRQWRGENRRPWRSEYRGYRESGNEWNRRWPREGRRHYRPYRGWDGYRRHHRPYYRSGIYLNFGGPAYYDDPYYDPYYYAPPRRVYRTQGLSRAHVRWCEARYRTYQPWNNTYVPRRGVRAQCISPYY